jgi:hypothetical protein
MAAHPRTSHAAGQPRRPALALRIAGGGTDGNQRLTALSGAVLIVLLAVIGVTVLRVRQLLWLHMFVGILLIGPLVLKMASSGYRFVRYYARARSYRLKGPPQALLRAIAPLVVASTLVVFGSGVALLFAGPSSRDALLPLHKISFIVWLVFTAPHVLAHLPLLSRALRSEYGPGVQRSSEPGRDGRTLALAGAIVAGVLLALLATVEFAPWMHAHLGHDGHG